MRNCNTHLTCKQVQIFFSNNNTAFCGTHTSLSTNSGLYLSGNVRRRVLLFPPRKLLLLSLIIIITTTTTTVIVVIVITTTTTITIIVIKLSSSSIIKAFLVTTHVIKSRLNYYTLISSTML